MAVPGRSNFQAYKGQEESFGSAELGPVVVADRKKRKCKNSLKKEAFWDWEVRPVCGLCQAFGSLRSSSKRI